MKLDLLYCARVGVLAVKLAGLAVGLTGCAGLAVSWSVVATYNTPHSTPGQPVPIEEPNK